MINAPAIEVTDELKAMPGLEAILAGLTRHNRLALQLIPSDELGLYGFDEERIKYFLPFGEFGLLPEGERRVTVEGIPRLFTLKDGPAIGFISSSTRWVSLVPIRDREFEETYNIGFYQRVFGSKINPQEFQDPYELFKAQLLEAHGYMNGLPVIVRQTGLYWMGSKRNEAGLLSDPSPLMAVVRLGWQRQDFPQEMFAAKTA